MTNDQIPNDEGMTNDPSWRSGLVDTVRSRLHGVAVAMLSLACFPVVGASLVNADDTVIAATGKESPPTRRISGEIIDYNGQELRIRLANGREERLATSAVREVIARQSEDEQAADQAFQARQFTEAAESYERALANEPRTWCRRKLLAQLSRCYQNMNDFLKAAKRFEELYRDDPATQYLGAIPVVWHSRPRVSLETTLAGRSPAGTDLQKLILSSWLLTGEKRAECLAALEQVTKSQDPRLAGIAEAQIWRTQVATATLAEVIRWRERLQRLPEELRPGPYYVVGQALVRLNQPEQAALAFLRSPMEGPTQRELGGEALWMAAKVLEGAGQREEARTLLQELKTSWADTPAASRKLVAEP